MTIDKQASFFYAEFVSFKIEITEQDTAKTLNLFACQQFFSYDTQDDSHIGHIA